MFSLALMAMPKFDFTNFTASLRAKNVFLLQHLGPPWFAMVRRLLAVIRLLNLHAFIDNGVEFVIRLMKMPVPTAAPQFP